MTNDDITDVLKVVLGLWPKRFNAAQLEALRPQLEPMRITSAQARVALQQLYTEGGKFFGGAEIVARLRHIGGNSRRGPASRDGLSAEQKVQALVAFYRRHLSTGDALGDKAHRERVASQLNAIDANMASVVGRGMVDALMPEQYGVCPDGGKLAKLAEWAGWTESAVVA